MIVNIQPQLDFFELVGVLVFARFPLSLGLLVLELTQVGDSANRRFGLGSHLDQVQAAVVGLDQGLAGRHHPQLVALVIDHPHFAGADFMVYTDKTLNR